MNTDTLRSTGRTQGTHTSFLYPLKGVSSSFFALRFT